MTPTSTSTYGAGPPVLVALGQQTQRQRGDLAAGAEVETGHQRFSSVVRVTRERSLGRVCALVAVAVIGPPLSQSLVAALPVERAGVGAALNSTTREVGSALGVAVVGTVTSSRFAAAGFGHRGAAAAVAGLAGPRADAARDAFAHAAGYGLKVSGGLLLLGTVPAGWWMRSPRPAAVRA